MMQNFDCMFSNFVTIVTNGHANTQTNRQTDRNTTMAYAALCGSVVRLKNPALSPVYTSNNVEATLSNASLQVKRFFRQCRN